MRWAWCPALVLTASAFSWAPARDDTAEPGGEQTVSAPTPEEMDAKLRGIGLALKAAAPKADGADAHARDAAAMSLGRLAWLVDAADEYVVWGVYDADKDVAVERCTSTRVNPLVLAKVYLSMFTFDGACEVRRSGSRLVLEIDATFRDRLNAGEYPYPLWSTPEQWGSYTRTTRLLFVFEGEALIGVVRKLGPATDARARRAWNGVWEWTDLRGRAQPRAAQFASVLSEENPEAARLESAYASMSAKLRSYNCLECHSPDSPHDGRVLTVLRYPNEALAVRESLAAMLKSAPTEAGHGVRIGGVPDDASREELARLAAEFAAAADGALSYEAARRAAAPPASVGP